MTTLQFIDARRRALEEYEKHIREQLKDSQDTTISSLLIIAGLEAFGNGFDAALKAVERNANPQ